MKKVLFTLNNMNIGGTEKAFLNYIETLSPEEYDITLLLLEKSGGFVSSIPKRVHVKVVSGWNFMKSEIMDPPLKVARKYFMQAKINRAFHIAFFHFVAKILDDRTLYYRYILKDFCEKNTYDIAIAYCDPFDFLTVLVLDFISANEKIQWIHFDVSKIGFNVKICRHLYPKFDQIRVVSDEAKEQLLNIIPEIRDKTVTFHNIVSAEQCHKMADMGEGFVDVFEGIRIVTVGRLSKEKGQDIIPEVAAKLKEHKVLFRWYLIGDGKLRDNIEQKCIEKAVTENIVFLGTQSNPYQYLKSADIYVQTSFYEGFCVTIEEAKVFNLPIISTECSGVHEQLDGRKDCRVVNRNVQEMKNAIMEIIKEKKLNEN